MSRLSSAGFWNFITLFFPAKGFFCLILAGREIFINVFFQRRNFGVDFYFNFLPAECSFYFLPAVRFCFSADEFYFGWRDLFSGGGILFLPSGRRNLVSVGRSEDVSAVDQGSIPWPRFLFYFRFLKVKFSFSFVYFCSIP